MRTPPSSSTARAYIHVHGLKAGDPEWALRIGDCLRNARTALDYLMGRLVCVAAGKGPMDIDDVLPHLHETDALPGRTAQVAIRSRPALSETDGPAPLRAVDDPFPSA